MADINNILEDFLEKTVNLNPDRYKRVKGAEETLGEFISNSATFKDLYAGVTPQGSVRQKTIIKPVGEDDEFDVDLLVMLEEDTDWSPADYHRNLADIFKDSDRYEDITDTRGKTRCVTIDYNSDFHVDLVPAIERDGKVYIFNKSTNKEECTDGDGYAQWFKQKDTYAGGYLVPVVRLIKYLRDSRNDFDTRSVILTTIIGMQVQHSDSFENLSDAFVTIIGRLDNFLEKSEKAPIIENPAMSEETFDRDWTDDDNKSFKALKKAVGSYNETLSDTESLDQWQELFGNKLKEHKSNVASTAVGITAPTIISNPAKPWASSTETPCNLTDLLKKN